MLALSTILLALAALARVSLLDQLPTDILSLCFTWCDARELARLDCTSVTNRQYTEVAWHDASLDARDITPKIRIPRLRHVTISCPAHMHRVDFSMIPQAETLHFTMDGGAMWLYYSSGAVEEMGKLIQSAKDAGLRSLRYDADFGCDDEPCVDGSTIELLLDHGPSLPDPDALYFRRKPYHIFSTLAFDYADDLPCRTAYVAMIARRAEVTCCREVTIAASELTPSDVLERAVSCVHVKVLSVYGPWSVLDAICRGVAANTHISRVRLYLDDVDDDTTFPIVDWGNSKCELEIFADAPTVEKGKAALVALLPQLHVNYVYINMPAPVADARIDRDGYHACLDEIKKIIDLRSDKAHDFRLDFGDHISIRSYHF